MEPAFSEEEISDISVAVDPDTPIGRRDLAVILLGYGTGLRGADITRLKLSAIDWHRQCANIVQSKTHQPLVIALNGAVLNAIADYVLYTCPECNVPQVFVTVKAPYRKLSSGFASMIYKYCDKAGVEKIPLRAFHQEDLIEEREKYGANDIYPGLTGLAEMSWKFLIK